MRFCRGIGGEDKKGERDKEVGPWPAIHNPQLGYHPSKGTWTPAHDLHIFTPKEFLFACAMPESL